MGWLKEQDLTDRFGAEALAQLKSGGASVPAALRDAEAECEAWVGRITTLPIVTAGAMLTRIACDIARYNLWRRAVDDQHPVYIAYRRAVGDLEDAAAGRMTLGGLVGTDTGASADGSPAGGFVVRSSTRVFDDTLLARVDSPAVGQFL